MRVKIINSQADLQAIGSRLGAERAARTIEEIEKLNPHVDFRKIERGTVLLVPDLPGEGDTEGRSVQGDAFEDLRRQVTGALAATSARIRRGHDALGDEAKEVTAALKSAPLKRALESDPELKAQVDAATAALKEDAAAAKTTAQTLKAMQDEVGKELSALAKLLG